MLLDAIRDARRSMEELGRRKLSPNSMRQMARDLDETMRAAVSDREQDLLTRDIFINMYIINERLYCIGTADYLRRHSRKLLWYLHFQANLLCIR